MPESFRQVVSQAVKRGVKRRIKEIVTGQDLYKKFKQATDGTDSPELQNDSSSSTSMESLDINVLDPYPFDDPWEYIRRSRTADQKRMIDDVKARALEIQRKKVPVVFRCSVWEIS
eukprot:Gregarina_sp_Poly_1__144@NODE_1031_length_5291_cov_107_018185_g716_i0_p6_GENE_NODE_1031_length_5291_cov_107_018185_g716_i0NODE_1031_length_5291_cov_107_018185_g716_i0_p6_ORF_typecomplete_len116_score17_57_NODE_1031_length_5291_cov_107_018185_g716_i045694916